jgi:ABC-type transporter Mla MlaB component
MKEFVLLDAAIWRDFPDFDVLRRTANAVPLYADLPSADASLFGPWLLEAEAFDTCVSADAAKEVPWRYGVSRLLTDASPATLIVHLESQRSIGMAEGDRYYLRFADTRALDALGRVLTPDQVQQLRGPVERWHYWDRFASEGEFGAGVPADPRRNDTIVLSSEQSDRLLERQLAGALADELAAGSGAADQIALTAEQLAHVDASAVFVLTHGIEPFDVQRHIAVIAVETGGAVLSDTRFMAQVESLCAFGQWHELMKWRVA